MADEIFKLLCSSAKIERDRGLVQLQRVLKDVEVQGLTELEDRIFALLQDDSAPWETTIGALGSAKLVLVHEHSTEDFAVKILPFAVRLLEDNEYRIRMAAGETLGALCKRNGDEIYANTKKAILNGIRVNLERRPQTEASLEEQQDTERLVKKLVRSNSEEKRAALAEDIFHDTAGWKSLETWMKCLQFVVEGCGQGFNRHIDQELLDLIFSALAHTNRFVRETGFQVCGAIVGCAAENEDASILKEDNAVYRHGEKFSEELAKGLSDNWSQVRLAASVATRKFLQSLPDDGSRAKFYADLLPRMCLNRYYVAEGVRIYSQETWRQITGGEGRHLVEQHIQSVVEYYISQTEADNHAVREAACACIAELGSKIDCDVVRPYVPSLLDALIVCFKDDSWPVRDASCVACGNFILCFPEEARGMMDTMYPLFFENLQDNIPSVRQGGAVALANVCKAYGSEATSKVYEKVIEGFSGVEKQAKDSDKYGGLDKNPAVFGVVKKARDNDVDLHSNQTMYSCGSLAPKMNRGKREGGCMDHMFRRPSEPWELADGCVYLLAELSSLPSEVQNVSKHLPLLAKATAHQHYTNHVHFLESLCKQLPVIAKSLGKRPFKMYVELFFDAIFYSLSCDNALTSSASSQCLNQLSSFLGANIMRGRVEQYNPRYLDQLEANQAIAPL
ncbi:uncharacterized protein LOC135485045 [Lineus longissimus]|uniref:uncharacterized protein LOC135485045 n=1 Tax=Lineus longissimus TaxID=88925 RepID=UPI002B4F0795